MAPFLQHGLVKCQVDKRSKPQDRSHDVVWSGDRMSDADDSLPAGGNTGDPARPAISQARVLEIQTPRCTTYGVVRNRLTLPEGIPVMIQERAWTSLIWYRSEESRSNARSVCS
jgi:hypothetical protein